MHQVTANIRVPDGDVISFADVSLALANVPGVRTVHDVVVAGVPDPTPAPIAPMPLSCKFASIIAATAFLSLIASTAVSGNLPLLGIAAAVACTYVAFILGHEHGWRDRERAG